jgi:putative pyruvate formate lyase activating enzyme
MTSNISRRDFIKGSLLAGCSLMVSTPAGLAVGQGKDWNPVYAQSYQSGDLKHKIAQAYAIFEECRLCPRACGVNRVKGELGFCRAPARLKVYTAHPHFGEERSLVGKKGSGTIFFSNCNLRCVFCQNWPIAHEGLGDDVEDRDLALMMLHLQKIGCHNVNLVTPTHVMPNILNALKIAHEYGLRIPLVYNTSGYETLEALKILDGVVDIYLPDMKYMDSQKADAYSAGAWDYPEVAKKAILEMYRQVGQHTVNERGVAVRGLMIRHLVMPNRVAGTEAFIEWLAKNLPTSTYVNIMPQYHVEYKAFDYPEIWRRITFQEYLEAMEWAEKAGLTNLDPDNIKAKRIYQQFQ